METSAQPEPVQCVRLGEFVSEDGLFIAVNKPRWLDILGMKSVKAEPEFQMTHLAAKVVLIDDKQATMDDILRLWPKDIHRIFEMLVKAV